MNQNTVNQIVDTYFPTKQICKSQQATLRDSINSPPDYIRNIQSRIRVGTQQTVLRTPEPKVNQVITKEYEVNIFKGSRIEYIAANNESQIKGAKILKDMSSWLQIIKNQIILKLKNQLTNWNEDIKDFGQVFQAIQGKYFEIITSSVIVEDRVQFQAEQLLDYYKINVSGYSCGEIISKLNNEIVKSNQIIDEMIKHQEVMSSPYLDDFKLIKQFASFVQQKIIIITNPEVIEQLLQLCQQMIHSIYIRSMTEKTLYVTARRTRKHLQTIINANMDKMQQLIQEQPQLKYIFNKMIFEQQTQLEFIQNCGALQILDTFLNYQNKMEQLLLNKLLEVDMHAPTLHARVDQLVKDTILFNKDNLTKESILLEDMREKQERMMKKRQMELEEEMIAAQQKKEAEEAEQRFLEQVKAASEAYQKKKQFEERQRQKLKNAKLEAVVDVDILSIVSNSSIAPLSEFPTLEASNRILIQKYTKQTECVRLRDEEESVHHEVLFSAIQLPFEDQPHSTSSLVLSYRKLQKQFHSTPSAQILTLSEQLVIDQDADLIQQQQSEQSAFLQQSLNPDGDSANKDIILMKNSEKSNTKSEEQNEEISENEQNNVHESENVESRRQNENNEHGVQNNQINSKSYESESENEERQNKIENGVQNNSKPEENVNKSNSNNSNEIIEQNEVQNNQIEKSDNLQTNQNNSNEQINQIEQNDLHEQNQNNELNEEETNERSENNSISEHENESTKVDSKQNGSGAELSQIDQQIELSESETFVVNEIQFEDVQTIEIEKINVAFKGKKAVNEKRFLDEF
ncbi:Hypothetical_protein [Hexamita inflata]|uniref:Hypothetical_protein n=1 Tax=Hexamita inflata TaxID=28002 RepID=A0AA86RES7_9EUKA|nr:Hypothetical protein HINF_LOCUS62772 [Hexamita inflata]